MKKLNKEVCKTCWEKWIVENEGRPSVWSQTGFDERWDYKGGFMACMIGMRLNPNNVERDIPENCPYRLEHLVSQ